VFLLAYRYVAGSQQSKKVFLIDFGDWEYIEDAKKCRSLNMASARNLRKVFAECEAELDRERIERSS
jgi:hypothetical protein